MANKKTKIKVPSWSYVCVLVGIYIIMNVVITCYNRAKNTEQQMKEVMNYASTASCLASFSILLTIFMGIYLYSSTRK